MKSRRNFFPVLLFFLILLGAGCGHKNAEAPSKADAAQAAMLPPVQVAPVRVGVIEQTLSVTGTLNPLPNQEATISPPVSGVLDRFSLHLGQFVQKGQEIAHLTTRTLEGQIQQAQATLGQNQVQVQQAQVNALQQQSQTRTGIAQALAALSGARASLKREQATLIGTEAALENARQNLVRQQTLLAAGVVARKDVESALLAVNTATAAVDAQRQTVDAQRETVAGQQQAVTAARAAGLQDLVKRSDILVAAQQVRNARGALATAQAQRELYTLRAPLSGSVTFVGATQGETVDGTTKIVILASLNPMQLQINVPSAQARQLHPGQAVRFQSDSRPGRVYQTTLQSIGTQVDPASDSVQALAEIANPDQQLRDNALARVQIVTARHSAALLVPKAAILTDPDTHKTSVVEVGPDNIAHILPITLGLVAGGSAEITSGVALGQQMAVSGQYALPDGTKVSVTKISVTKISVTKASVTGAP